MTKNIHIATYQRVVYRGITVAEHFCKDLPKFSQRVVIRFGGTMPYDNYPIQVNSANAVKNSINKYKQKELLLNAGLPTLPILDEPVYPCVIKGIVRSGGINVHLVKNKEQYKKAVDATNAHYYIEPLFNTTSEYRLHCTRDKVFFTVKKQKRNPNDIIVTRDNHYNTREFLKPRLWDKIQETCIKAMAALDLDIACFDILYDSSNNQQHTFTISEANTNPEFLNNTYNAYLAVLPEIINKKIKQYKGANNNAAVAIPNLTDKQLQLVYNKINNGEYTITGDIISIKIK